MIPFPCDSFRTFVRIATAICLQAWRAETTSAGVEGPGSMAPLKHVRPGGPGHHGSISCKRLNWYISPSGLAFHGVATCRWFTPPAKGMPALRAYGSTFIDEVQEAMN
jgi:hypothetical protein